MLTRRRFLCAAATGAALFARVPHALAANYDLLIKGGHIIDPSLGLNAIGDVAILDGRIAAVEPGISGDAAETIDARGKLVVTGLIAIRTHRPLHHHLDPPAEPLPYILPLLKRADIVTHMYAPAPHVILDYDGRLLPEVLAARRRGVWFDVGNGTVGHITWDQAERAMKQGFLPHTISTDWTPQGRAGGVIDLPNIMSK